ncbi:MAG: Pyrimidine-specific ribonucleoside hydrolase RihA [bacterium]|nr:Pyrimidine-specific ribonucleoside hydrolase RihA [bacterium]
MRTKILLDTDIGSDIDDAVCLAYLLANPQCELLGITTVTGEADKRAMMASALCKVVGKKIPIFPGAEQPLLVPQQQTQAQQAVALAKWEHDKNFPHAQAVEFLRQTIRAHPGEIVLLTIGPLTNIGLLFGVDPEIPSLLKGLVMMCGRFTNRVQGNYGPLEWNAICDPHATAIVYRATVRQHRSIGLDVTSHVNMSADEFREKFRRIDLFRPVLDFAEIWFQQWPGTTFHDPLAAATIFDEQICTFQKGTVEVELVGEKSKGMLFWQVDGTEAKHEIALEVNSTRFFEHFFSVFQ